MLILPTPSPRGSWRLPFFTAAVALSFAASAPSTASAAMVWHYNAAPSAFEAEITASMNGCIATFNAYSNYAHDIGVIYSSGTPTADAGYLGQIRFGGSRNYRTAMHEASHWLGTGTVTEWDAHQRFSIWNGTYAYNLRAAYDGPGERQFIYGAHYGPQGANYDSEGVQGPQMVGIIGAFRRDMNLWQGDQTIGIASGTYRLRNRLAVKTLDGTGATAEGAQPRQTETTAGNNGQLWNVNLITGTPYFTLRNVTGGKYLDSLGSTTDGAPVALTSLVGGTPSDSQLWQILQTDSFFFNIVNKANGKALDNLGLGDGAGVAQWAAGVSGNQQWTFLHALAQTAPAAGVVSQGRPVSSSSTEANHYDTKGNNGVSGDRWTASSSSYPQWWRVDTGTVQPITRVEIDWFPDGAPVFQYRIEVSNDDINWTVAADRTANLVAGTTIDHLAATGRFVRVTMTGGTSGYFAAFMECRVFNEVQNLKLLSLFRPSSASSEQIGNLAVNANNVDPVFTRWCSATSGYPAWWQVDLGSVQQVSRAVIAWFDDEGRSYRYRIEGSSDGVNFTTLIDRTDNTAPGTTADNFSGNARYVRVNVTGGSSTYPSIYDVQIYGSTVALPPSPPASFSATGVGSQVNVAWSAVAGATSYTLKRSLNAGGPYATIATQTATTFIDTAVSSGVSYYYVVSVKSAAGTSADSTELAAATGVELRAHLPFNETGGVVALDASGFKRSGALLNGALWTAGQSGNAVDLDGTNDYVALPSGAVATLSNFTVAAWVNPDTLATWARLFDFGTGTDNYMFLAPSNGTAVRFAIRTPSVAEQTITGTAPLPAGTWSHVAVTLSGNTGTIYVNGVAVGTNTAMSLRPSNLGVTTQNWIGRSQWPDPYFDGKVDEFRIYNRALSVAEIGKLRELTAPATPVGAAAQASSGRVLVGWAPSLGATNYQVKRATTSGGPYATIATLAAANYADTGVTADTTYHYVVTAQNAAGESASSTQVSAAPLAGALALAPSAVLNAYEVGSHVKLIWSAVSGATSYNLKRATTSGGPYATIATLGTPAYTDTDVALGTTYYYVVAAVGAGGEGADSAQVSASPSAPVSAALLKMDESTGTSTADETGNGLAGTLINGPTRIAGRLDSGISLDGSNDHIALPSGALSAAADCTFAVWVRPAALPSSSRVFDFGTGTGNTLFLAAAGTNGKPVFTFRLAGMADQTVQSAFALPLNTWSHLAVTISGTTARLYLNGTLVGANGNFTLKPSALGITTQNWIGRSQGPDPYFSGAVDEFQLRTRALTPTEVAALATPPLAPTGFAASAGTSQVALSWNTVVGATGYHVKRATVSGGPYATLASNLSAPGYTDTSGSAGTPYYYVVTALKTVAESARSTQQSATPLAPLTPEQTWRQTHFGTMNNEGPAADAADPDGDGASNFLERAFAGDPNAASSSILPAADPASATLSLVYRRAKTATDLSFMVEESTDLSSWSAAAGSSTVVEDNADYQLLRHTRPVSADVRLFLRVRVFANP